VTYVRDRYVIEEDGETLHRNVLGFTGQFIRLRYVSDSTRLS